MRNKAFKIVLCCTLVALFFGIETPRSSATVLLPKSMDDLVNESTGIVIGTVTKVASAYSKEREIYTFIVLKNLVVCHGVYKHHELVIRQIGGRVDNDVAYVDGAPVFCEGDRVLMFLKNNGASKVPFVGWSQGVFFIKKSMDTGEEIVADSEGNEVTGLSNGIIIRKQYNEPESIRQQKGSGGTPDYDGGEGDSRGVLNEETPISTDAFLGEVQNRLKLVHKKTPVISSVPYLSFKDMKGTRNRDLRQNATGPAPVKKEGGKTKGNELTLPKQAQDDAPANQSEK